MFTLFRIALIAVLLGLPALAQIRPNGGTAGGGGGSTVTGPASSADGQMVVFDGTTGKIVKTFTGTGIIKTTAGVPGIATSGTDYEAPLTFGNGLTRTLNAVTGINAAADGATKGVAAFAAIDFNATTGVVSIDYTNGQKATSGQPGFLTSMDWSTFNGKASLTGAETLTNKTLTNPSLGAGASSVSRTETAGTGGVTANLLAAKDTTDPTRYIIPTSGGCGSGVAAATATVGNTFQLYSVAGTVISMVADGTIVAGDIVVGGTSTPGRVADSGQTSRLAVPNTTCIVGVAKTGATVGNAVLVAYDGPGTYGGALPGSVVLTSQSNTYSSGFLQTLPYNALGAATAPVLTLQNSTAAANGAQQWSPAIVFGATGYKSNATAASQAILFRTYVQGVQGTTVAAGNYVIESSVAGGGYTNGMTFNTTGILTAPTIVSAGNVFAAAAGGFNFNGRTVTSAPSDGTWQLANSGNTAGFLIDGTTDGTAKFRNRGNSADGALTASTITASGNVTTSVDFVTANQLRWSSATRMDGITNGNLRIQNAGQTVTSTLHPGAIPTITACGTGGALNTVGTDWGGFVTEGTVATGCTITFGTAFTTNAPGCRVSSRSGIAFTYTVSVTAIVITNVGAGSSTIFDYDCVG